MEASYALASTATIEVPLLELLEGYGAVHGLRTMARSIPYVAGAALVAQGLHNIATFEANHLWTYEDFNDLMGNPLIPDSVKEQMLGKMSNDPLLARFLSHI